MNPGDSAASTLTDVIIRHASVPAGTPVQLFQSLRWDPDTAGNIRYSFPVTPGRFEVRLYFAETYLGGQSAGFRKFDVKIEDQLVLDDYDIYADVGGYT